MVGGSALALSVAGLAFAASLLALPLDLADDALGGRPLVGGSGGSEATCARAPFDMLAERPGKAIGSSPWNGVPNGAAVGGAAIGGAADAAGGGASGVGAGAIGVGGGGAASKRSTSGAGGSSLGGIMPGGIGGVCRIGGGARLAWGG